MSTIHVIIDPQNDFIDNPSNNPSLAVTGAQEDMERLSLVLASVKPDAIIVTLDSHAVLDIAHTSWWKDENGQAINPFTAITSNDILSGKFICTNKAMQDYSLEYTKALESGGKYTHFIWPNHCIVGTKGHEVYSSLNEQLQLWQESTGQKIEYLSKGMNPKTEHYSAFKAEVPVDGDESTKLDMKSINYINSFDKVVFSGEALSHCVKASVMDFLENIPKEDRAKVVLLEDCMSSVPGFEKQGEEFLAKAKEMGASLINAYDYVESQKMKPKIKP